MQTKCLKFIFRKTIQKARKQNPWRFARGEAKTNSVAPLIFTLHKFKHKTKKISSIPATINLNEIYNLTFAVIQLNLKKILRVEGLCRKGTRQRPLLQNCFDKEERIQQCLSNPHIKSRLWSGSTRNGCG